MNIAPARIINIGVLSSDCTVPHLPDLSEHELTFIGSNMYVPDDYNKVIEHLAAGDYKTEGIITHHFSLEQVSDMYKMIDNRNEFYLKLMICITD